MACVWNLPLVAPLAASDASALVSTVVRILLAKLNNDGVVGVGIDDRSILAIVEDLVLLAVWLHGITG